MIRPAATMSILVVAASCLRVATPPPLSSEELVLDGPCQARLIAFEAAVLEHRSCQEDTDCAGIDIRPAFGCCCYGASRAWAESESRKHLTSGLCGRALKLCARECTAVCVGGTCRAAALTNAAPDCGTRSGEGPIAPWTMEQWREYLADGGR